MRRPYIALWELVVILAIACLAFAGFWLAFVVSAHFFGLGVILMLGLAGMALITIRSTWKAVGGNRAR